ncbi:hypothetical protein HPY25_12345, partial [Methylobacterium sp. IIF4SW-B5]|nr:hypothetical protein [Methylobacterium ajmalii]
MRLSLASLLILGALAVPAHAQTTAPNPFSPGAPKPNPAPPPNPPAIPAKPAA